MAEVARCGWPIGLRFDPLIYDPDYQRCYRELFERIAVELGGAIVHSVSLGPFRLPRSFFRTMERRYPDAPLLAGNFVERGKNVSYPTEIENEMVDFCTRELSRLVSGDRLYRCEF